MIPGFSFALSFRTELLFRGRNAARPLEEERRLTQPPGRKQSTFLVPTLVSPFSTLLDALDLVPRRCWTGPAYMGQGNA